METPDFEAMRRGELIQGPIGPFLLKKLFSVEEVTELDAAGIGVPMDLLPHEYWSPPHLPFPRFGEEMLGADF